jgi:hypothetical protein
MLNDPNTRRYAIGHFKSGGIGVRYPAEKMNFLFSTAFKPALEPTQLYCQGLKRPAGASAHSPLSTSSAEFEYRGDMKGLYHMDVM